jgi:hypothetical protein
MAINRQNFWGVRPISAPPVISTWKTPGTNRVKAVSNYCMQIFSYYTRNRVISIGNSYMYVDKWPWQMDRKGNKHWENSK